MVENGRNGQQPGENGQKRQNKNDRNWPNRAKKWATINKNGQKTYLNQSGLKVAVQSSLKVSKKSCQTRKNTKQKRIQQWEQAKRGQKWLNLGKSCQGWPNVEESGQITKSGRKMGDADDVVDATDAGI